MPTLWSHSPSCATTNCGPLLERMNSGFPYFINNRCRASRTSFAFILERTATDRASRVYSSRTVISQKYCTWVLIAYAVQPIRENLDTFFNFCLKLISLIKSFCKNILCLCIPRFEVSSCAFWKVTFHQTCHILVNTIWFWSKYAGYNLNDISSK